MGQYYYVANLDKKEYLNGYNLGEGSKLMEFSLGSMGVMSCLAILLADGNGQGSGDINEDPNDGIVGRWAGDRIVIAGDYANKGKFLTEEDLENMPGKEGPALENTGLYDVVREKYTDISFDALFALMRDSYVRNEINPKYHRKPDVVEDFKKILSYEKLKDLPLLISQMKSPEGKAKLEKLLKG